MRYLILLFLFGIQTDSFGQDAAGTRNNAPGYDYCQVSYNSLLLYKQQKAGFEMTNWGILAGALVKHNSQKVIKTADSYNSKPEVKISRLDGDFDLAAAFRGKVYVYTNGIFKNFYFLKNDSTLVEQQLKKGAVWELTKEREDRIYPIHLGGNKVVYWSVYLGMLYKTGGQVESRFLDIRYQDQDNRFALKDTNTVNRGTGYFERGNFLVQKNKPFDFTVFKGSEKVIDAFPLKYYNDSQLVTMGGKTITFYNNAFGTDSSFSYRDFYAGWGRTEYLSGNVLKTFSTRNFIPANAEDEDSRVMGCGNVTRYTLHIKGQNIGAIQDGSRSSYRGNTESQNLVLHSPIPFDSLLFINRSPYLSWSDNGGFDNRMILIKNGLEGLYTFEQKNDSLTFTEVVPPAFQKIALLNGNVILKNREGEEFLDYYLEHHEMRFRKLENSGTVYTRYQKADGTGGWLKSSRLLFDDI